MLFDFVILSVPNEKMQSVRAALKRLRKVIQKTLAIGYFRGKVPDLQLET